MLKLNTRQIEHLQSRLDREIRDLDKFLNQLVEARRLGFGGISYRLGWDTVAAMETDQLCSHYQMLLDMASGKRENSATLESLVAYYDQEFESWSPQHSTNSVSNLEHEGKFKVIKRLREDLRHMKRLADSGEETATQGKDSV